MSNVECVYQASLEQMYVCDFLLKKTWHQSTIPPQRFKLVLALLLCLRSRYEVLSKLPLHAISLVLLTLLQA